MQTPIVKAGDMLRLLSEDNTTYTAEAVTDSTDEGTFEYLTPNGYRGQSNVDNIASDRPPNGYFTPGDSYHTYRRAS